MQWLSWVLLKLATSNRTENAKHPICRRRYRRCRRSSNVENTYAIRSIPSVDKVHSTSAMRRISASRHTENGRFRKIRINQAATPGDEWEGLHKTEVALRRSAGLVGSLKRAYSRVQPSRQTAKTDDAIAKAPLP